MSSVVIKGDTSGQVALTVPSTAGSNTITLPAVTGTAVVQGQNSAITSGTSVASTSGTSIDFTSIPSWVKRITVMFSGVSTNGTSNKLLQLGTGSTTYTTTGYTSTGVNISSTAPTTATFTTGFGINSGSASETLTGTFVLVNQTGNTWIITGSCISGTVTFWSSGSIALGAALTAVRITTVNGTDTFDAGSINILYE